MFVEKKKFWTVSQLDPHSNSEIESGSICGIESRSKTYYRRDPDLKPDPKLLLLI